MTDTPTDPHADIAPVDLRLSNLLQPLAKHLTAWLSKRLGRGTPTAPFVVLVATPVPPDTPVNTPSSVQYVSNIARDDAHVMLATMVLRWNEQAHRNDRPLSEIKDAAGDSVADVFAKAGGRVQ